jgi:hypothetical protein
MDRILGVPRDATPHIEIFGRRQAFVEAAQLQEHRLADEGLMKNR